MVRRGWRDGRGRRLCSSVIMGVHENPALPLLGDVPLVAVNVLHLGGKAFGVVLRHVAEHVPALRRHPAAGVAADARHDQKAHVRRGHGAGEQLRGVTRREPGGEVAAVFRTRLKRADAHAHELQPVALPVHAAQRLAEHFAHAVIGVRAHRHGGGDDLGARVKADGVNAGRERHAPYARLPRRFQHVVSAVDIHRADVGVAVLIGNPGEVNDGVHALHDLQHGVKVGEVGEHDFLSGPGRA